MSFFGTLETVELNDESLIVDNGNLVGFTEGLSYSLRRIGRLKSSLLGGEGVVYEFKGTGKVYIQTRNMDSFADFLMKYLPIDKK
ncbi:AIM24 family protein [Methanothermococcus okinawensis]|uniref:AIM24 family protein n=1 Tax=Methanothermococcus okinawensis TaxID=155863 RepID=UPI0022B3D70B|nr:AIM24 family protein [Methanothermococcus okinawensis]